MRRFLLSTTIALFISACAEDDKIVPPSRGNGGQAELTTDNVSMPRQVASDKDPTISCDKTQTGGKFQTNCHVSVYPKAGQTFLWEDADVQYGEAGDITCKVSENQVTQTCHISLASGKGAVLQYSLAIQETGKKTKYATTSIKLP